MANYGDGFTKDVMSGHGHVYPRPDGTQEQCGGPRHCKACRSDLVSLFESGRFAADYAEINAPDPYNVLADMLEALKPQLLIYMVRKLGTGGRLVVQVADLDENRQWGMAVAPGPDLQSLVFSLEKKS